MMEDAAAMEVATACDSCGYFPLINGGSGIGPGTHNVGAAGCSIYAPVTVRTAGTKCVMNGASFNKGGTLPSSATVAVR